MAVIPAFIDELNRLTLERHGWLLRAGEKIKRDNEILRGGSAPNKPLPSDR